MAAFVHIDVDVVHIYIGVVRTPVVPVGWIVAPVVWRIPSVVSRSPEPGEYRRHVNVNRFDDVVRAVDVRITNYLYIISAVASALNYDGSHILKHIVTNYCLKHYKVRVSFGSFDYTKIIHLSVAVQVKVVNTGFIIIDSSLEFFQIARVCKYVSYRSQVKVVAYI